MTLRLPGEPVELLLLVAGHLPRGAVSERFGQIHGETVGAVVTAHRVVGRHSGDHLGLR